MKQQIAFVFCMAASLVMLLSLTTTGLKNIGAANATAIFEKNALRLAASASDLHQAVLAINQDTMTVLKARDVLKECRLRYKSLAFFSSYFFPSETMMYNAAPKYEVEEPELELVEPMGLQQIEALLFAADVYAGKADLQAQTEAFYGSVKDLKTLLYQFRASDSQVLEGIRLELIRIMTLYISGYDAPLLKTGICESLKSSQVIQQVLDPYFAKESSNGIALAKTLEASIQYLNANQQFDTFNRMEYLVQFAIPLQQQLSAFIKNLHFELNTSAYLDYDAGSLFDRNFIKQWDSIPELRKKELIAKGKQLFFDKNLSGNLKVSCATCHQPENYFSDGKIRSSSIFADTVLKRNTPTLLYAGRQHAQFWDGRSKNLVEQVKNVIFNPLEMAGKRELIGKNIEEIALALAAYVSSLNPLNSPFDHYLKGDKKAMNDTQIKGFNLFMGKAQCGTCHFAPYFNSLVPPFYDISEVEILGTPKDDRFEKPEYDTDMVRYDLYKIRYYKQAFKTPTVRNAEKTGPYMHNGTFKTLETVLDFYNKGGGNGLGLRIADQTLSAKPLNLSKEECSQIIQFINSLTDNSKIK